MGSKKIVSWRIKMSEITTSPRRETSDFSIKKILSNDGDPPPPKCDNCDSGKVISEPAWLYCTRYRPPKLQRKSLAGKCVKRKSGTQPRIPFSKEQLETLEEKYRSNPYVSKSDVAYLSETLQLPQNRASIILYNNEVT